MSQIEAKVVETTKVKTDQGWPYDKTITKTITAQEFSAQEPPNRADTAELLKEYRAALINAYELGEDIKTLYPIIPPRVITNQRWGLEGSNRVQLGLTIS